MAKLVAVVTIAKPIGEDDGGDGSGVGEEANRGSHCIDVLRPDCDGDRCSILALPQGGFGVEEAGREDGYTSRIPDRCSQGVKEVIWVIWEVGDGEGVDGKLGLIGCQSKGEPGQGSHWEGLVESGSNAIEIEDVCHGQGVHV